ncbi:cellulose binding domain-containing protein [Actinocrinis puniceicyclus]|uniref:Cellulose binding domain-containing protein n=1 Tax=Actinocrinis puniceicyclus TaxID=977794 RepID=A0A8J8BFL8_9ACTN|nr:cellulose binding domain-containing protein [Actinocrinis puniceicyclus]MBS2964869.1 cellulose binding domain-containing protein [Actinocrinis puniceicyclus]
MKRSRTLPLALLAFGGVSVAAPSTAAAAAIPTCTYSYSVSSQWSGGFSAQLTVDFAMTTASSGWTAGFDFVSSGQHVTTSWNANIVQYGEHVTITNSPYSPATMQQSGSLTVNFMGTFTAGNPAPVDVTFDGVACSSYSWNV